jgi:hypothetical protein
MDALSAALSSVRMTGAIFANAIRAAPWDLQCQPWRVLPPPVPGDGVGRGYHLLTEGRATVGLKGGADLPVCDRRHRNHSARDPHTVANGAPSELIDSGGAVGRWLAGDVTPFRTGGRGELTRCVCGYLACLRQGRLCWWSHRDRRFDYD